MKSTGKYVDGFLLAIPRKKLEAYRRISHKAGKIWQDHGALEYRECVGDDLNAKNKATTFPKRMKLKPNEIVIFSWIVYKSKSHRDTINAEVRKDPRTIKIMDREKTPFDMKRMSYGGFKVIVNL
jgi:uncharacterized protein YbaA (DUF1428 family)